MGATLTIPPPPLALTMNPLIIQVKSDNYLDADPVVAINVLQFKNTIFPGVSFKVTWALREVVFTASETPDDSGTQFLYGGNTEVTVRQIMALMARNYYVGRDYVLAYILSAGYPSIQLTAKLSGSNFNLSTYDGVVAAVRPTQGVNAQLKANFSHLLAVTLAGESASIYAKNISLDIPVDGSSTKDISGVIEDYLDYDIPVLNQLWQVCTKSAKNYKLQIAQFYGEIPDYKIVSEYGPFTAALGGYSQAALGIVGNEDDHLAKYLLPDPSLINYQRWFETYPVNNFIVRTNQVQFLYFMNMREMAEQLDISVVITYSDGTTATVVKPGGILQPRQKACIGCGYQQLGLPLLAVADKTITGYTVQMVLHTTNDARSLIKRFTVDRSYEQYTRYILYSNSSGGFSTLHTYGQNTPVAEISSSLAERFDSRNTPVTGNFSRYDIRITETDELNTGYLVGDQSLDSLQELMLAKYAFRIIGDTLMPIVITGKKMGLEADGQNLNALKIEYRKAYDEKVYTGSTGALMVPRLNQSQQAINDL